MILLEQKMSHGADDDQADNSAFQEQDEELDDIDRDLGAQDKASYLRKVNKLGNRNGCNDESSLRLLALRGPGGIRAKA